MKKKTGGFRLRLNLFDGIVVVLALAVGAFLLWRAFRPAPAAEGGASPSESTVRYTVRFRRWPEGTSSLVQPGDKLADNIKNYELGTVVEAKAVPSETLILNHVAHAYVLTYTEGYEDVLVTVEAPAVVNGKAVTVGGGYELRVGATAYLKGEGYMASGPIEFIERRAGK